MTRQILIETMVPGKPLGRHIDHDPRSLQYLVPEATTVLTKLWKLVSADLNQGDLGSCTGNALVDTLGTEPYVETLPAGTTLDETLAVAIYSDAEKIDGGVGYPPEDNGSSGLSVAKAAKARRLINGYLHITSVAAAHKAIQSGPFLFGTNWYTGMDSPDATGVVQATGTVRGGHEVSCYGYDAATDLWWFRNSWGPSYGLQGNFAMTTDTFAKLLAEQGDGTVLVPLTSPAPQPAPTPAPAVPLPTPEQWATFVPQARAWISHRHEGINGDFAADVFALLQGLPTS